jgi:anhydro-N-acetylmuramic acid kinase
MKILEKLFKKKRKLVIGLMSGTSADGIDAALVEIRGSGTQTSVRQIAFQTHSFPSGFKRFLLQNSDPSTARLDDIPRLDMLIATLFADAAKSVVREAGYRMEEVDLIGSHGQTIQHLPNSRKMFGRNVHATMQVGNPSVIAKMTGVVTVGDFRTGDVALGGSGAPLVPYFDYLMFRSSKLHRALLNVGGIANITVLPRRCSVEEVIAFDTGPGNMIVDALSQKLYHEPFDRDGGNASVGKIIPQLLRWMMAHRYFRKYPPKSTGREMFGEEFLKDFFLKVKHLRKEDILATASEFTALSVYDSYLRFIRKKTKLNELLVSGGGVHNMYIMNALKKFFNEVTVKPLEHVGVSSDAKEAICFAVLANETISGNPNNIPNVTGAKQRTPLGVICLP